MERPRDSNGLSRHSLLPFGGSWLAVNGEAVEDGRRSEREPSYRQKIAAHGAAITIVTVSSRNRIATAVSNLLLVLVSGNRRKSSPAAEIRLLEEGCLDVVKYLVSHGHPLFVRDRWGATPLDEAKREKRSSVYNYLKTFK